MDEQKFPDIFNDDPEGINYRYAPRNKLERSQTDFIISGVCAAIGNYLKIDTSLIRIIWMISLLLGEWSVAIYFIASLFIPLEISTKEIHESEILRKRKINLRTVISGIMMTTGVYLGLLSYGLINRYEFIFFPDFIIFPLIFIGIGFQIILHKNIPDIYNKKLPEGFLKSKKKIIFGVCRGISNYLGSDHFTIRVLSIILSIITLGLSILIYLIFAATSAFEKDGLLENEI